jgi:hypothetical protein
VLRRVANNDLDILLTSFDTLASDYKKFEERQKAEAAREEEEGAIGRCKDPYERFGRKRDVNSKKVSPQEDQAWHTIQK